MLHNRMILVPTLLAIWVAALMLPVLATAPNSGQKAVVSEDQLLDRDEAIYGKDAEHVKAAEERGDTVIGAEDLEDAREVFTCCLQPLDEHITFQD